MDIAPLFETQQLIGWQETVALPALGISQLKVKVDTGARTSALHALQIQPFKKAGKHWVRFAWQADNDSQLMWREAAIIDKRAITNSGGQTEQRYVIQTLLQLAGREWPIELSLSNRERMKFRMLLGRSAMVSGALLVDPAVTYQLTQNNTFND